jgi:transcription-repair coupling factor (superfamily II helicase)
METGPEVDLQSQALIPEDYLPDIHARLVLYKRIASTETEEELRALKVEMIDRFGLLPDAVKTLFSVTTLKQQAVPLGIKKVDAHIAGGRLVFTKEPKINTDQLIKLIQTQPQCYKFDGVDKLKFNKPFETVDEKINFITELLEQLTPELTNV